MNNVTDSTKTYCLRSASSWLNRPGVVRSALTSSPASSSAALQTKPGAHERDRTADLVLTKDVLCRLSYVGNYPIQRSIPHAALSVDETANPPDVGRNSLNAPLCSTKVTSSLPNPNGLNPYGAWAEELDSTRQYTKTHSKHTPTAHFSKDDPETARSAIANSIPM